ncbi:precorrin-6Y C5,15-methyltransferase (decarboxylating) subunit CbiT [Anaerosinus sp.]|uniref:precorrin-6Y C5,15-methyltransferase (decarboxylating) subunit CbiT n=1 Tax=Selenobaculum sp. TaxID=3074374 RepID=UPI003AB2A441
MYHLGIPDHEFIRGKTPMTKEEIRILTIAKAQINPDSIIWDVGAGTGSLSIEAALSALNGHVYAIERNREGIDLIQQNAAKFKAKNLTAILGEAPSALLDLPSCDVAFIGGSGGKLSEILTFIDDKLKVGGRLIINAITIETMYEALQFLKETENYSYNTFSAQITRFDAIGRYHMGKAQNPITIISCTKLKNRR